MVLQHACPKLFVDLSRLTADFRDFLNGICTDIVHVYEQKLLRYKGNYDEFVRGFEEKKRQQAKEYEKQEKKLKELKRQAGMQVCYCESYNEFMMHRFLTSLSRTTRIRRKKKRRWTRAKSTENL